MGQGFHQEDEDFGGAEVLEESQEAFKEGATIRPI